MSAAKKLLCALLAACMLVSPAAAVGEDGGISAVPENLTDSSQAGQEDFQQVSLSETQAQTGEESTSSAAEEAEERKDSAPEATPAQPEEELPEETKTQTQKNAEYLYQLGVLRGTGTDEAGQPLFGLDQPLTRIEVMVMLIRLMGGEKAVSSHQWDYTRFQDAGTWEKPYICYAYAQGLTQGVSQSSFGAKQQADARQCLTFLLRALGYYDTMGDFSYQQVLSFAAGLGILTQEQVNRWQSGSFTRGDLVDLCAVILKTPMKNGSDTLEDLILNADGRFTTTHLPVLTYSVSGSTSVAYGSPVKMAVTISGLEQPMTVNYAWAADGATISSGSVQMYNGTQFVYEKACQFLAYDPSRIQTITLTLEADGITKTLRRQCLCKNQSVNAYIQGLILPTDVTIAGGKRIVYGKSGAGRDLVAYEFGTGSKVLFLNFAIHGFEDHWAHDGYELVLVAERMMQSLSQNMGELNRQNWRVVVVPCANPDGVVDGWTNNGPGRCTTHRYEGGNLVSGGIDLNRSFSRSFTVNTNSRNYTTAVSMAAPEAQALGDLIRQKKSASTSIFLDIHGWTRQTITSTGRDGTLNQVLGAAFPGNRWSSIIGAHGYVANYAYGLGYQSGLFEFPSSVTCHDAMVNRGYDTQFVQAMWNLMKKY